jgi:hypothetical protein
MREILGYENHRKGVWSFYHVATGAFLDRTYSGREEKLAQNTPADYAAWCGPVDSFSQRINVATKQLEDFQPPSPGDDYEWIHDDERGNRVRRWKLKLEVQQARERNAASLSRIEELERKQHRRVRELLEDKDPQLKALSDEIASLRKALQ